MSLSKRKPNRLPGYDYSQNGCYFITICVKNNAKLLGGIVGDGVLDVPKTNLSAYGKIADKHIVAMSQAYPDVQIDTYIIMPNHIHLLIKISKTPTPISGTSRTPSPTNDIIPAFVSTFKRFCNKEYGRNIWQRSYHDHVVRNEKGYQKIWEYITYNPSKWKRDCFYTE